jgi:TolA-binding protein
MGDLLRESFGYVATIIGALTAGTVAILRERYKSTQLHLEATREDTTAEEVAIQAARVDERTQCEKQIAALRVDLAELRGRIDEQSRDITEMGRRSERSDRRTLVAEGRAMAMKSIAEAAGADQATIDMIWERHDPDTIAGRMAT